MQKKAEGTEKATVKVFIRRPMDERNVKAKVVGVNGKMYTVPYDTEVEVPACVAEVLEMSGVAQKNADMLVDALAGRVTEL